MTIALIILGFLALVVAIIAVHDLTQRQHAVTRNFPVIGHFRDSSRKWANHCASISSLATAMSAPTTASRVRGCTRRQRARTTSLVLDQRLITPNRDGWSSYRQCIRRSRLVARAKPIFRARGSSDRNGISPISPDDSQTSPA